MTDMQYSIILPSYSEARNLKLLLPELNQVMSSLAKSFEIIVIDTQQSQDNTQEICSTYNVKYVNREPTDSYGDAFRTGLRVGLGKYFIFMDSDGSHTPDFIPKMINHVEREEVDLIIASRYIQGGKSANNPLLLSLSKVLNAIYSKVLKINCKDVSNSFRLYRAALLIEMELTSNNFDILEEVLFKLIHQNKSFKLAEIPYSFQRRRHGKSKRNFLMFSLTYLITLLKLQYKMLFLK